MPRIVVSASKSQALASGRLGVTFTDESGNGYCCNLIRFRADGGAWRYTDWRRFEAGGAFGEPISSAMNSAPTAFTTNSRQFQQRVEQAAEAESLMVDW